jgi:hypothetical protein
MMSSENPSLITTLIDDTTRITCRKYRKLLVEGGIGIRTPRQAMKILAVLVESGVIYILIGVSSALVFKHGLSSYISSGCELGLYLYLPALWTRSDFWPVRACEHAACGM